MKFDIIGIILLVIAVAMSILSDGMLLPFALPLGAYGLTRMDVKA